MEVFREFTASWNRRNGKKLGLTRFSTIREKNVSSVVRILGCLFLAASTAGLQRRVVKDMTSFKNDTLTEKYKTFIDEVIGCNSLFLFLNHISHDNINQNLNHLSSYPQNQECFVES